jgi:pimeloyl-ACP methyl ester carboxylesterase
MPSFDSDGIRIAYETSGDGEPIVLVHGFASSRVRNWKNPGWFETLAQTHRRIVALDCRGHGESDKPHDPSLYRAELMTGDVVRLLDHLGIERADLMGYSMGGRLTAALLARHGERFRRGVLAGVGRGIVGERLGAEAIARALEADAAESLANPTARAFRAFAEQGGNDLPALAACMRGLRRTVETGDLAAVRLPVLVVAGGNDDLATEPEALADLIPGARLVTVPGRDHLTTVGDRRYKEAVLDFLR